MKNDYLFAHTPNANGEWHSLRQHLEKVAKIAKKFAAKFGAGELGKYAGLWHDLGKYQTKFQEYLEQCYTLQSTGNTQPPRKVPHAIHGARLAWDECPILAPIIYGHHGGLPAKNEVRKRFSEPELEKSYTEVMIQASQDLGQLKPDTDLQKNIQNPPKDALSGEFFSRMLFSCLVDADYLDTEEHFEPDKTQQRGSQIGVKELWSTLEQAQNNLLESVRQDNSKNTLVNRIRAEVYHACFTAAELEPGIFRLAVPTGGSKTRSGLSFALRHAVQHDLSRVIVAVPYTSIIEQTVAVYRNIFGYEAVLENHSAVRTDLGNEEDARRFQAQARLAAQNWDAPLIVTTTVQLFESLFANRPAPCRKLHNLIGSVLVLDEVQTLPIGLLTPIVNVLQELVERYQVTVVLCTATQPALEEKSPYFDGFTPGSVKDIVPKEQAKAHFQALIRVNYELPTEAWSWEQLAQDVQANSQALVILNTRKDALSLLAVLGSALEEFQSLEMPQAAVREVLTQSQIFHLSTLLCGAHRREVLEEVRQRLNPHSSQPCLLVATQVVEAGVDFDFPVVYRALGPLDRIVQAAGRCNREGQMQDKGRVVIFEPQDGSLPRGEYATAVAQTKSILQQPDLDLHTPAIFAEYFQSLYQGVSSDKHQIQSLRRDANYPKVAEKFKLIQDDMTPVVIQYDKQVLELLAKIRRRGLLASDRRQLQPYLVNLRRREFQLSEAVRELIAPGLWVWRGNYSPIRGIAIGKEPIAYDPVDLIQ